MSILKEVLNCDEDDEFWLLQSGYIPSYSENQARFNGHSNQFFSSPLLIKDSSNKTAQTNHDDEHNQKIYCPNSTYSEQSRSISECSFYNSNLDVDVEGNGSENDKLIVIPGCQGKYDADHDSNTDDSNATSSIFKHGQILKDVVESAVSEDTNDGPSNSSQVFEDTLPSSPSSYSLSKQLDENNSKSMHDLNVASSTSSNNVKLSSTFSKSTGNVSYITRKKPLKLLRSAKPDTFSTSNDNYSSTAKYRDANILPQSNLYRKKSWSMNNLSTSYRKKEFTHVESKVKKYIKTMKEKDARNKPISLPSTPMKMRHYKSTASLYDDESLRYLSLMNLNQEEVVPADLAVFKEEISSHIACPTVLDKIFAQLICERKSCIEQFELRNSLQAEYNNLLLKYSEAQNVIDFLRFKKEDYSALLPDQRTFGSPKYLTSSPKRPLTKAFSVSALSFSFKSISPPEVSNLTKYSSSPTIDTLPSPDQDVKCVNKDKVISKQFASSTILESVSQWTHSEWLSKHDEVKQKIWEYNLLERNSALNPIEQRSICQFLTKKYHELSLRKPISGEIEEQKTIEEKLSDISFSFKPIYAKLTTPDGFEAEISKKDNNISAADILTQKPDNAMPVASIKTFHGEDNNFDGQNEGALGNTSYESCGPQFSVSATGKKRADGNKKYLYPIVSPLQKTKDTDSGCPPSDRSTRFHSFEFEFDDCSRRITPPAFVSPSSADKDIIASDSSSIIGDSDIKRRPYRSSYSGDSKASCRAKKFDTRCSATSEMPFSCEGTTVSSDSSLSDIELNKEKNVSKIRNKTNNNIPSSKLSTDRFSAKFVRVSTSDLSDSSVTPVKRRNKKYITGFEQDRVLHTHRIQNLRSEGFSKVKTRKCESNTVSNDSPLKAVNDVMATSTLKIEPIFDQKISYKKEKRIDKLGHHHRSHLTREQLVKEGRKSISSSTIDNAGLSPSDSRLNSDTSVSASASISASKKATIQSSLPMLPAPYPMIFIEHYNCCSRPPFLKSRDMKQATACKGTNTHSPEDGSHSRPSNHKEAKELLLCQSLDEASSIAESLKKTSKSLLKSFNVS